MNKLVIKGAYYYCPDENIIVVPHYTGEYYTVDCNVYMPIKNLKERYDSDYIKGVWDNFITYQSIKYYYAEYSPISVGDNWILLSDLSKIAHNEEVFNWE